MAEPVAPTQYSPAVESHLAAMDKAKAEGRLFDFVTRDYPLEPIEDTIRRIHADDRERAERLIARLNEDRQHRSTSSGT